MSTTARERAPAGIPLQVVRGACPHNCPDTCAWTVTVKDGVAVELRGDSDHPFTRGGLCAKVNHFLEDRVNDPARLLHPLRRTGAKGSGDFEQVSWAEALEDISVRLKDVVDAYGGEAILPYWFSGTQGLVQNGMMARRFFARIGATRLIRSICGDTASEGIAATLGTDAGALPEQIANSRFIILWGANTLTTNLHLWPFILQARAKGARIVAIDPVRTRTAAAADQHIAPMPGTDAALALGLMHVILDQNLQDDDYIDRYTLGFEQLRERIAAFPPDRVAAITGLDEEVIVQLARDFATTPPAMIRVGVGLEKHEHGAMALRTIACLPALTGAWRDLGGGLAYMTWDAFFDGLDWDGGHPVRPEKRVRSVNMVQLGRALTELSDPPVQALIVFNSNPATIAPNQDLVLQGLRRDDLFTVVSEHFMTDTARYADYLLPATTQIEHLDLMWAYGHSYLTLNQPAIAPRGEAIPNSEFFRRLAQRMGFDEVAFRQSDEDMVRAAIASGHDYVSEITFEDLVEHGWVRMAVSDGPPYAAGGFPTQSGKCEFYSASMEEAGFDPLPTFEAAIESPGASAGPGRTAYPLALIAGKSAHHFLNSSYGSAERALKAEEEPFLQMNPDDAASRTIHDKDVVRVFNGRGEVQVRVRVGDGVRPGVVAMPFGWWGTRSPSGSSANVLTQDGLSDLGGGTAMYDTLVEVERQA